MMSEGCKSQKATDPVKQDMSYQQKMTNGIYLGAYIESGYQGIYFHAQIVPQYSSSSGWACGIGLLASKSLSYYKDTAIGGLSW